MQSPEQSSWQGANGPRVMRQAWLCWQQMVACRQEKAQNLARDPLQPLQHMVMLPSRCSFTRCWGQEASGDVPSRARALLSSASRLTAWLGPGTASVFPRQFGKQKVRASVCGELRSAFSSSSAAQPLQLSAARCQHRRSPPPPPPGRGKRVPVYFWVGSRWGGSCGERAHPAIWLPPLGATSPSAPLSPRCRGSRGQGWER